MPAKLLRCKNAFPKCPDATWHPCCGAICTKAERNAGRKIFIFSGKRMQQQQPASLFVVRARSSVVARRGRPLFMRLRRELAWLLHAPPSFDMQMHRVSLQDIGAIMDYGTNLHCARKQRVKQRTLWYQFPLSATFMSSKSVGKVRLRVAERVALTRSLVRVRPLVRLSSKFTLFVGRSFVRRNGERASEERSWNRTPGWRDLRPPLRQRL